MTTRLDDDVVDAHRGTSTFGRGMYRARLRARMLPKFWAGEALVRSMRSPRALRCSERVLDPQWLASNATALVGEQPSRSVRPTPFGRPGPLHFTGP